MSPSGSSKRSSRIFVRKLFGFKTWREFERDLRQRRPIEAEGVEVIDVEPASESDATEGSEQ